MTTSQIRSNYGTCIVFNTDTRNSLIVRKLNEIPANIRECYQTLPKGFAIPDHVSLAHIMLALNLPGSFDYAIPQDFFDQYMKEHGTRPFGVWYYPPHNERNHIFGEFLPLDTILYRLAVLAETTWNEFCQAQPQP